MKKTKILILSASPKINKSRTFALAKEFMKGLPKNVKVEIIHLIKKKIKFCLGCESCHKTLFKCPFHDDGMTLMKKMTETDGIVFVSPNYINLVTASMKALFDRASHLIHCSRLRGKYAAAVITSGSGYDKQVEEYLRQYANVCGAQFSGAISCEAAKVGETAKNAAELGKKFASDIRSKRKYPAQIKGINALSQKFRALVEFRKSEWKGEYAYLKENESI